ncbi:MAG: response regulator [Clostridiales bacterium]|jgi:two-component system response regulator YesN|nr:response regulator [Clostridiales bacterium]
MTALLADDDIEMLDVLRDIIDWEAFGFTELILARDGQDALNKLDGAVPALLVADIDMPTMDGYALVESLRGKDEDLPVIFLTCYEDFPHTRKAIVTGVDDYLVKYSLTKEVLREALENVQTRRSRNAVSPLDAHNSCKEKLLFSVMSLRQADISACLKEMKALRIPVPVGPFRLVGLYADYDEARLPNRSGDPIWRYAAANVATDFLRENNCQDVVFPYERYILLAHAETGLAPSYLALLSELAKELFDKARIHSSLFCSSVCPSFSEIASAIEEIASAQNDTFYGDEPLNPLRTPPVFAPMPYCLFNENVANFHSALETDMQFACEIDRLCSQAERNRFAPDMVRKLFQACLSGVARLCQQAGVFVDEVDIHGASLAFCRDAVAQMHKQYTQSPNAPKAEVRNEDVAAMLKYVEQHLGDKISLQTAADAIFKNSSHLSRLFKKEMGINFSEYLIEARIRKATELLEQTRLPVEEIAERIGIDNVSYFYKFYKRETGRTPRGKR